MELSNGGQRWAIPWPVVHEFLAVVTHPRIFRTPTPPKAAVGQVDAWLESPTLILLSEELGYWDELRSTFLKGQISGPRVHDARIAALCATISASPYPAVSPYRAPHPQIIISNA
jgi:predicted nucleic acid-binding protein